MATVGHTPLWINCQFTAYLPMFLLSIASYIIYAEPPVLLDQKFLIAENAECYLRRHSASGQWVDEMMKRATPACIGKDMHCMKRPHHSAGTNKYKKRIADTGPVTPVRIGLIGEVHYVSLHSTSACPVGVNKTVVKDDTGIPDVQSQPMQCSPTAACDSDSRLISPVIEPMSTSDREGCDWPSIWSAETWSQKKETYPFLFCLKGKLGCNSCRDVGHIQTLSGSGWSLVVEWVTVQIQQSGKGDPNNYVQSGKYI
jgi:hypothetical protein